MKEQAKKFPRKKSDDFGILQEMVEKILDEKIWRLAEFASVGELAQEIGFETAEKAIQDALKSRGMSVLGRVAGGAFGVLMGILWPADAQAGTITGKIQQYLEKSFPESKGDLVEKIILFNTIHNAKRTLKGMQPDRLPYSMPARGIIHRLASTDLGKLRDQAAKAAENVDKAIIRTGKWKAAREKKTSQTQSENNLSQHALNVIKEEIEKFSNN